MNTALIGYTGFVGTTLRRQTSFVNHYNSSNIDTIDGKAYSLAICAAAPAAKWKANQDPEADIANLNMLMRHLETISVDQFVLISTVDVYKSPIGVDESTPIDVDDLHAYGKHRYLLELFVAEHFSTHSIIRLPGLFGTGLRKNFLFDMIHKGESPWTHRDSVFQFYNMANLWQDVQIVLEAGVPLINFATAPVKVADIAQHCFDTEYTFETDKPPVSYDMRTQQAGIFGINGHYMMSANGVFTQIRAFAEQEKSNR